MSYALLKGQLIKVLADFFETDYQRITHAVEVMQQAELLQHHYTDVDTEVLLTSALLHDVGIKPSEKELGYNDATTQEQYGPAVVQRLLEEIGFDQEKTRKVMQIVGNHHSRSRYDYVELEILKLADLIVNRLEVHYSESSSSAEAHAI
ncbi:MAG: HD domain-containing protein [Desulfuromonadaceae bacterium]